MSLKIKALGLGLLAAMAMSAIAVMNASATTGGHFTSEVHHTTLDITDEVDNEPILNDPALGSVRCHHSTYESTISGTTVTEVTVIPTYTNCTTGDGDTVHVTMNGCDYKFTIGEYAHDDNTVHLECPTNKKVELHTTGPVGTCTISIHPQTLGGIQPNANHPNGSGVAYTTTGSGTTHGITVDLTVRTIAVTRHAQSFGACAFASTNASNNELKGEVEIIGTDTEGNQKGITATGSQGQGTERP